MTVAVRRGTGPKARLTAFLAAYDAYQKRVAYFDGDLDSASYEELCELQVLEDAMQAARKGITTNLGLGD
jgi:hypothetical protein